MNIYICKMCGRALKSEKEPTYCYADRMDSIEGISDEDAQKMGISDIEDFEFPGDVKFSPFTGEKLEEPTGHKLSDFQDNIMRKVLTRG